MLWILAALHIVVCIFLILVVLLQTGRGADLAGAFGMSGSQTAFGPRGTSTLLSKMTTWMAFTFMVTSVALYIVQSRRGGSVIREPAAAEAPAQAGETPAQATEAPADEAAQPQDTSGGDQIIQEEVSGQPQNPEPSE